MKTLLATVAVSSLIATSLPPVCLGNDVKEAALPVSAARAFENLVFDRPIVVTHADDGSNRIFVAEQEGVIKVFENDADVEEADVFLDIDKRVTYKDNQNEEGLLAMISVSCVLQRMRNCSNSPPVMGVMVPSGSTVVM